MNRSEFSQLVLSTQEGLRRFLLALCCGDSALADDLAQEAYVKAYMAADSLADVRAFPAWLRRIAYNTFVSSRRAVRSDEPIEAARTICADTASDDAFRYQALYMALARLSDRERSAVALFYFDGFSIKEIAEISNASEGAVKQLLSRARAHLKDFLS